MDEDEEEDDEEEVKEELKPVEDDVKPVVKRKLRLPTREALEHVRKARVATTEELFKKVALTESINKVIVSSGNKKDLRRLS